MQALRITFALVVALAIFGIFWGIAQKGKTCRAKGGELVGSRYDLCVSRDGKVLR